MHSRALLLSSAAVAACLPEYEQIQGERLLYEYSEELHPCAGTAPYMDRLVPFLERQLTLSAPKRLRYSWVPAHDEWEPFGVPAGAKGVGTHAWASEPTNVHELAHVVTGGMPAMFFVEGVASAVDTIGDGLAPRYPETDAQLAEPLWDPRATMTATNSGGVNYGAAAAFVTFLLVRHGPEPFHEFYRGLGGPVTMTWLRARFRKAYGLELDDEIASFRHGIPPCEADAHPLPLPECSAPTVAWGSETRWEHEVSMACDEPGVVGGISPKRGYPSFYAVTIEVPVGGYHVLQMSNLDVTVRLGPCFGCPWDPRDILIERESPQRTMILDPGTYYLRVNSTSDESPEVTVRLQRL